MVVAVTVFSPGVIFGIGGICLTILGLTAAGWGAFKSQAANGWRMAAEGYREQLAELNGRFTAVEQHETLLQQRVDQLETLPDMRAVVEAVNNRASEIVDAVRSDGDATRSVVGDAKGVLDELAARGG